MTAFKLPAWARPLAVGVAAMALVGAGVFIADLFDWTPPTSGYTVVVP